MRWVFTGDIHRGENRPLFNIREIVGDDDVKQRFKGWVKGNPAFSGTLLARVFRFCIVGALCTALALWRVLSLPVVCQCQRVYTVGYVYWFVVQLRANHLFHLSSKATRGNVAGFVASHAVNYLMEIGLLNLFLWLDVSKWLALILDGHCCPNQLFATNVVYKKRE